MKKIIIYSVVLLVLFSFVSSSAEARTRSSSRSSYSSSRTYSKPTTTTPSTSSTTTYVDRTPDNGLSATSFLGGMAVNSLLTRDNNQPVIVNNYGPSGEVVESPAINETIETTEIVENTEKKGSRTPYILIALILGVIGYFISKNK